ncbi:carboxymuconolactone decarboxylase family protein [Leclercia adecarboxylata]|uniref:Carboxymuconolactone decarboxylase family protein n=1 Tax=Leclercia adecarboxylata TaxID=83655 RepID=A0A9X3YAE5_9ENTR|nr:carboxymuconolactone decarboxylase family protein [Leclercia adecarboxylata]MBD1403975.1 carboxymuconolactone decarboxylase family protein [Leclercia adecarboxylata]MDC6622948.1 carboxymuconolactone decarboxylase family protein [Leclercia adecarboxylata]MDC6634145.1 carboxymuconolactone decarboxylase family protein [Leclercia adecarboxylata]MDC6639150.1 carboxymuconolactone decarboxylase family protein [Leclercia adecarboxylata]MDC6647938.1 carboxymuconolactone decarboxylase family protein 
MTTPRVTPWQDGEPVDADLLNAMKARRPGGELIGIDRILLKSFPLATGWNELMVRVRQQFSLSLEYRELIMLRVASLNKAEFEWNVHYPAYLNAGGTAEKAAALEPVSVSSLFNETETLLIRLTDQSTHGVVVDADIIDELKRRLGEKETVEAVATVAAYNMVSRFLVALAI